MVVPRHRRRDDEVAVVHPRPLAVHGRVCAVALEYEAQRALGVAMGRCDLARQHELDPGIEIGRDLRLAAQPGILEDEHAPLGFFCRNQPPGLDHRGPNVRERPRGRLAAADRLRCDEFRERPPQRRHVLLTDALVERETLGRLSGRRRRWRSGHATSRTCLTVYGQYLRGNDRHAASRRRRSGVHRRRAGISAAEAAPIPLFHRHRDRRVRYGDHRIHGPSGARRVGSDRHAARAAVCRRVVRADAGCLCRGPARRPARPQDDAGGVD